MLLLIEYIGQGLSYLLLNLSLELFLIFSLKEGLLGYSCSTQIERIIIIAMNKETHFSQDFLERLSNLFLHPVPTEVGHIDPLQVDTKIILHLLTIIGQWDVYFKAVPSSLLLLDLSQYSTALHPVLELINRIIIIIIFTDLDVGADFVLPPAEDCSVVLDEEYLLGAALTDNIAVHLNERVVRDIGLVRLLSFNEPLCLSELIISGD